VQRRYTAPSSGSLISKRTAPQLQPPVSGTNPLSGIGREPTEAERWELYLHHLFTRLGFDVTANTALPQGRSRPDFPVSRDKEFFHVEAATVFSGIVPDKTRTDLEPKILDIINTIDGSNFFVSVHFVRSSTVLPKRNDITRPIKEWMAPFDPDDLLDPRRGNPETRIRVGDWEIGLRLVPRSPEAGPTVGW
jgi:hypothetical protein